MKLQFKEGQLFLLACGGVIKVTNKRCYVDGIGRECMDARTVKTANAPRTASSSARCLEVGQTCTWNDEGFYRGQWEHDPEWGLHIVRELKP